jgi:putative ABC transport system permease protein
MLIGGFTPINAFAVMLYTIIGCIASSVLALGIALFLVKSLNSKQI